MLEFTTVRHFSDPEEVRRNERLGIDPPKAVSRKVIIGILKSDIRRYEENSTKFNDQDLNCLVITTFDGEEYCILETLEQFKTMYNDSGSNPIGVE